MRGARATGDDSEAQAVDGRHRTRPRASVTEAPVDDAALLVSACTLRSDGSLILRAA